MLIVLVVMVLLVSLVWLFRKYRDVKLRLDYETNDIRNLASLPKDNNSVAELKSVQEREKYASLNEVK